MADIFLSYKKEDRDLAESIISSLEMEGFSVWYDERLNPLQSWDATIEAEIKQASAVVVLWTARSVGSEWVRNEADYGKEHAKLIPLLLEDCEIPLAFRRVQAANLISWDGATNAREWRKACEWINNQVHGTTAAQAAAIDTETTAHSRSADTSAQKTDNLKSRPVTKSSTIWVALATLTAVAGIVIYLFNSDSNSTDNKTPSLDPRLQKAKLLYEQAYFLTPRNIGPRMHLESERSRLCITSDFEPPEWENLFRTVDANKNFKSWSLGFDHEIVFDQLSSGNCLILAVSEENLSKVEQLSQMLEVELGKQYEVVPMTQMYEPWELGLQ
jgi:hypothetical protein